MNTLGRAGLILGGLAGATIVLGAVPAGVQPRAERPNLLVIVADDLGIGDVSCYNSGSAWKTPAMDEMARAGCRFTDAHAASSLCTPSRYALLTGRYAWRGRLKHGVVDGYERGLIEPGRLTVPSFLKANGYVTAMFGKWHLGLDWAKRGSERTAVDFSRPFGGGPRDHGFDRFLGIAASLDMPPYVWLKDDRAVSLPTERIEDSPPPKLWRGGPIAPDFKMEDVQPRLIQASLDYLGERAAAKDGKPFFLYVALAAPHTPILPTAAYAGRTGVTSYGDFVTQVDADIGRIRAALRQHGFDRNTMVIVTSDNGFAPAVGVPEHLRRHHDPSAGYRGYKSDLFEGGHRMPFIVTWPGRVPPGTQCDEPVGQWDLLASCAALLGVRLPADAGEDSVSLLPLLHGRRPDGPLHEALVHHSGEGRFSIRQGDWKLLLWPGSGGWSTPTPSPSRWLQVEATDLALLPPFQLYDLAKDPAEKTNLADRHPEVVRRLGRLMRRYIERGRSTPGEKQPFDSTEAWPETAWMNQFPDK